MKIFDNARFTSKNSKSVVQVPTWKFYQLLSTIDSRKKLLNFVCCFKNTNLNMKVSNLTRAKGPVFY